MLNNHEHALYLFTPQVVSRISDLEQFVGLVESVGFEFVSEDVDNTHFVMIAFTKSKKHGRAIDARVSETFLAPCIYKRR